MEILQIIIALVAGAGFWRLIESLLTMKSKKRLEKAKTANILTEANTQVTENWIAWSTKMEQRVNELESKNTELLNVITKQRIRITELEKQVVKLEKINASLNKNRKR